MESRECENLAEQTDVESNDTESTAGAGPEIEPFGSETDFTGSMCSSKDEFDMNRDLEALVDSQFKNQGQGRNEVMEESVPVKVENNVQGWVNTVSEPEAAERPVDSTSPVGMDQNTIINIDTLARTLAESVMKEEFIASAWNADDQTVPTGNFMLDFERDATERLSLHLMNSIKVLCGFTSFEEFKEIHRDVLILAAILNSPHCVGSCTEIADIIGQLKTERMNIDGLMKFRGGEYFSDIRLRFNPKTVSKNLKPIIQAVQDEVNRSIGRAQANKNPEIFSNFGDIVRIVNECNTNKSLGFSPRKAGDYAHKLQKAVFAEMNSRCLSFLAHLGIPLKPDFGELGNGKASDEEEDRVETDEPMPNSSQGSVQSTSEEELVAIMGENGNAPPVNPRFMEAQAAMAALRNSPGFRGVLVEFMRGRWTGQFQQNHSPVASMNSPSSSWTMYSPTMSMSPHASLPERERSPIVFGSPSDSYEARRNVQLGDEIMLLDSSQLSGMGMAIEGSLEEGEGPQRLRRRLD